MIGVTTGCSSAYSLERRTNSSPAGPLESAASMLWNRFSSASSLSWGSLAMAGFLDWQFLAVDPVEQQIADADAVGSIAQRRAHRLTDRLQFERQQHFLDRADR